MNDHEPEHRRERHLPGAITDRLTALSRARLRPEPETEVVYVPVEEPRVPPRPGHTVPNFVVEGAAWSWRLLSMAALALAVVYLLTRIPIVTVPFVVALLLTAVLGPVQRWFQNTCRLPHGFSAVLALLVGVAFLGAIGNFVARQITGQAPRLMGQLEVTVVRLTEWLQKGPLRVSDAQVAEYSKEIQAAISRNQEALLTGALSTASTLTHALGGALLVLLATFFLLRDGDTIWNWVLSLLPRRSRPRINHVGRFGWRTLGGFMRGQTIIALLHAVSVFIVLVILEVPLAPALAVLVFVGSYVPILGMTIAGTLCVVVSLIEDGMVAAIVVAVTILVLIQLEAHLLQPFIMARTVEVHPLGVAMAVLAGTSLGGIAGALFAVPLVAFANATIRAANMPLPTLARSEDEPVDEILKEADAASAANSRSGSAAPRRQSAPSQSPGENPGQPPGQNPGRSTTSGQ